MQVGLNPSFGFDLILGLGNYTPGRLVETDYLDATEAMASSLGSEAEGRELKVYSSMSLMSLLTSYSFGLKSAWQSSSYIFGIDLGVEGPLNFNLFEDVDASLLKLYSKIKASLALPLSLLVFLMAYTCGSLQVFNMRRLISRPNKKIYF